MNCLPSFASHIFDAAILTFFIISLMISNVCFSNSAGAKPLSYMIIIEVCHKEFSIIYGFSIAEFFKILLVCLHDLRFYDVNRFFYSIVVSSI